MSIEKLKDTIKDYAKDLRLNLSAVLSAEGAPGLSLPQVWGTALACAYKAEDKNLIQAILQDGESHLSPTHIEAAKAAASIMGMNNVYYRTMHLLEDRELAKLPAKLRMNVLAKPGIDKVDFELYSLGVSAISGCSACVNAHVNEAKKAQISNEGIQSVIRISAVMAGVAQALAIG
jgi:alkyl hydroperoxide reductase subunit D